MSIVDYTGFDNGVYGGGGHPFMGKKEKVLLREVEYCAQCGDSFLSLYPLKKCADHGDLEKV